MAVTLCNVCNIRRPYTGSKGTETAPHGSDMCNYCYEEGGWENTHSDAGHNGIQAVIEQVGMSGLEKHEVEELETMKGCWICHPEINLARQPAKAKPTSTGPKKQGVRRPQFNHKGHSHPQTPAARRACKEAFWGQPSVNVASSEQIMTAQSTWNYTCDGNGKKAI